MITLGVDVGTTRIKVLALDVATGRTLALEAAETPVRRDAHGEAHRPAEVARDGHRPAGQGEACPGARHRGGGALLCQRRRGGRAAGRRPPPRRGRHHLVRPARLGRGGGLPGGPRCGPPPHAGHAAGRHVLALQAPLDPRPSARRPGAVTGLDRPGRLRPAGPWGRARHGLVARVARRRLRPVDSGLGPGHHRGQRADDRLPATRVVGHGHRDPLDGRCRGAPACHPDCAS